MKPDRPLTFSDGERIVEVLETRHSAIVGSNWELTVLVELPAPPVQIRPIAVKAKTRP
jgi:hypothetical protein